MPQVDSVNAYTDYPNAALTRRRTPPVRTCSCHSSCPKRASGFRRGRIREAWPVRRQLGRRSADSKAAAEEHPHRPLSSALMPNCGWCRWSCADLSRTAITTVRALGLSSVAVVVHDRSAASTAPVGVAPHGDARHAWPSRPIEKDVSYDGPGRGMGEIKPSRINDLIAESEW